MSQINFRIGTEDMKVAKMISESTGISLAELARKAFVGSMKSVRVDLAFDLLAEGKCGFKKAWQVSGLAYEEFLAEWAERGAKEVIPGTKQEEHLDWALNVDLKKYLKNR